MSLPPIAVASINAKRDSGTIVRQLDCATGAAGTASETQNRPGSPPACSFDSPFGEAIST